MDDNGLINSSLDLARLWMAQKHWRKEYKKNGAASDKEKAKLARKRINAKLNSLQSEWESCYRSEGDTLEMTDLSEE